MEPNNFAVRLRHLVNTVHPKDRGPYTLAEISAGVKAGGIATITPPYLSQLLQGARDNPTLNTITALAQFFGVPTSYFFDDAAAKKVDEDLALLKLLQDREVLGVAQRVVELSEEGRRSVAAIVAELSAYESGTGEGGAPPRRRRRGGREPQQ
ncbi:helix-turn-helix domain-containing protein [Nocardioides sp.]|uniref:helix-turn-helix domain-containing protein n=1 Tax=Nocardioides sp. TaxID=35761 RepID=UPI003D0F0A17